MCFLPYIGFCVKPCFFCAIFTAWGFQVIFPDQEREGKFTTLDTFIQNDIISIDESGVVTIKDIKKLKEAIKTIDEQYEELRTERMLSDIGKDDER